MTWEEKVICIILVLMLAMAVAGIVWYQCVGKKETGMRWKVYVREVHVATYEVDEEDARTVQEAALRVDQGYGILDDTDIDFSHILGMETWTAQGPDGKYYDDVR